MKKINRKKQAENIASLVIVILLIWVLLSFIDTNIHNQLGAGYGQYHKWNAIILFFNLLF